MTGSIPSGLVISAPASGTGKTTVTLGLLRALTRSGVAVQPFKCGPDYIDPAFHAAASGRPSANLDSWAVDRATLESRAVCDADLVLAEGAMGLFDGVAKAGETGTGASADIAALMGWPVVLVVDVSGAAQTAAMVARGVMGFRPGVTLAGVVLNRVASPRHEALVRHGMEQAGVTVLGAIPRRAEIAMPERHLGLVQAGEQADLPALLDALADLVEAHVDMPALRAAAAGGRADVPPAPLAPPPGQRIALARDAAFSFVYPHLIDAWRAQGAEVLPFSPLADEAPDSDADCVWMPGGYPELHGPQLAQAATWRAGMQGFDGPIHGECGGYMALGAGLVAKDGGRHQMAGLLGLVTSYETRKMHLGYRLATLQAPLPGYAAGARLRGHEFHYSTILDQPDDPLAEVRDATDTVVAETGSQRGRVTGTFFHLIGGAA